MAFLSGGVSSSTDRPAPAAFAGRSRTFYILAAIREHLDDLEDVYLAEQRLVDLRLGKSHAVPLEDVMARDGVDDRA